jgi:hypothetical protein
MAEEHLKISEPKKEAGGMEAITNSIKHVASEALIAQDARGRIRMKRGLRLSSVRTAQRPLQKKRQPKNVTLPFLRRIQFLLCAYGPTMKSVKVDASRNQ